MATNSNRRNTQGGNGGKNAVNQGTAKKATTNQGVAKRATTNQGTTKRATTNQGVAKRAVTNQENVRKVITNQKEKRRTIRNIIFVVEIIIILAMVGIFVAVTRTTGKTEGPKYAELKPENLGISDEMQQKNELALETGKGYMNIALFGVDAVTDSQLLKGSRSDSIMIASVNMDTGDIKLVSVYRDTFLNLSNDSYRKCNTAYSLGGAEQAVKMLNMNLDMDIENFVTVGYKGLREVIDGLGGIYIDVDETELKHINNYQISIVEEVLKCDYTPVTEPGYQKLDGLQAAAYCRIRYGGGDDFKRASRQREVLMAIEEQAKKADFATLKRVFESAIDDIYTSLDSKDILDLLANIAKYRIADQNGFPQENMRTTANIGAKGSSVIPTSLESNVVWLHQYLFEDQEYEAPSTVKEYSQKIEAETTPYINKIQSEE